MPPYLYFLIAAGTFLWCAPFVVGFAKTKTAFELDRRARWGVILEAAAYTLLWQSSFWQRSPQWWQVAASVCLFVLACSISWTGVRALGRHLRVDAGLDEKHELIRSGPYRFMRHPIYTSMLCVVLGTGVLISSWPLLLASVSLFLVGTEIRMRVEDKLLASRFGQQFEDYRRAVPRLIPFVV